MRELTNYEFIKLSVRLETLYSEQAKVAQVFGWDSHECFIVTREVNITQREYDRQRKIRNGEQ